MALAGGRHNSQAQLPAKRPKLAQSQQRSTVIVQAATPEAVRNKDKWHQDEIQGWPAQGPSTPLLVSLLRWNLLPAANSSQHHSLSAGACCLASCCRLHNTSARTGDACSTTGYRRWTSGRATISDTAGAPSCCFYDAGRKAPSGWNSVVCLHRTL